MTQELDQAIGKYVKSKRSDLNDHARIMNDYVCMPFHVVTPPKATAG